MMGYRLIASCNPPPRSFTVKTVQNVSVALLPVQTICTEGSPHPPGPPPC